MTNETGGRKLLFLMSQEQAETFARLSAAAEHGDGDAACRLGDMYREGMGGVRYSPKETYRWYAKSALAGDPNGQNNLGACYEHGLGCAQSYAKAVKWYRLSVAQGLSTASMNLGYCYLHGHGVTRDQVEALRLFREAVERGEERAQQEVEKLEALVGPRASLSAMPNPRSGASRPEHSPADTQQVRPCSSHGFPTRDGPPENLGAAAVTPRNRCTSAAKVAGVPTEPSEPDGNTSASTRNASRQSETSNVQIIRGIRFVDEAQRGRHAGLVRSEASTDTPAASTGRPRPRVRFVDRTEPGQHIGVVGAGGVSPPESGDDAREQSEAGWTDEDFERVSLGAWEKDDCFDLPEPGSEYARVLMAGWDELLERLGVPLTADAEAESRQAATEQDLFPIFAEGGLQPGDLVGGIAERYAEYLKRRTQQ